MTEDYVVYGREDKCKEPGRIDTPYLISLDRTISERDGIESGSIETDPCMVLFKFKAFCDLFNEKANK
jgi:hypothetical protein